MKMPTYHPKKRLGQNFLNSDKIISKIAEVIDPHPGERIIEIGPGRGALTVRLAESGASITAIEFDRDLIAHLSSLFGTNEKVEVLNQDFLLYEPPYERFKLVGNLPYNITSPVIDWCVRHREAVISACFMIQKEVARRLSSSPGGKDWSPLAIFTQLHFDVRICFDVAPKHFEPPPKVTSSVVELTPCETAQLDYPEQFERLVRQSFKFRRKVLSNNLVPDLIGEMSAAKVILEEAGLATNCRAEQVSTEQFLKLTKLLVSYNIM